MTPCPDIKTALVVIREQILGLAEASGHVPLFDGGSVEFANVSAIGGGVLPGIFKYRISIGPHRPRWRVLGRD